MEFRYVVRLLLLSLLPPGFLGQLPDIASNQLPNFWAQTPSPQEATGQTGIPTQILTASQTVGSHGPVLLQDSNLIDHMAHFNRERIPERVVHAKGGGAFGVFEVTHDISQWTKARPFAAIGKKTPVLIRFSTTMGESGAADTVRDGRGFAVKFYSEDGNWDLVGNNLPTFPIRDPILFPSLVRSRKRNPVTHLHDHLAFWDFNSLRPESTFHTLLLFSDLGIPDGFRFQHGFGVHTFKLVNGRGEAVYVKFHFRSNQGIRNLDVATAQRLNGDDPDYAIRDLYNAIAAREFPSWDMGIQIMTFKEAETYRWNPFDITKLWPFQDFPLIPVGKLTLNKNPTDYFTQIEQAGFSPSNMIPGIEPSPDRMLHGRMFSYPDTQRYRLGPNFLQLPVNRPLPAVPVVTYQKDGFMCSDDNGGGLPNYFPNSFNGPLWDGRRHNQSAFQVSSPDVVRFDIGEEDNYSQVDWYWKHEMDMKTKQGFIQNLSDDLKLVTREIQARVVSKMFDPVNSEISSMLRYHMRRNTSKSKNGI